MTRLLTCALTTVMAMPTALGAEEVDLDAVRAALDKYQDVNVALADGYIPPPDGHCFTAEMGAHPAEMGAMGLHYLNPALLQITGADPRVTGTGTHTDFMSPGVLIYEPQADGSLVLVAAENLVFEDAWNATGQDSPSLNGRPWDYMKDDPATEGDEAHGFAPHYDQHVWLWRENPAGMLEPYNTAVTCEHHMH